MRLLVIGGSGTIGSRLVGVLRGRGHDVITASRSSGDLRVDLTSEASIAALYPAAGRLDGVLVTAAHGALDEFATLTGSALLENMRGKFFGQVDVVLHGQHHLADGGSFTLTSGIFADRAWPGVTGGAVISGALHSFVLSAAIELPRGQRINVISPTMVAASAEAFVFPGMDTVPTDELVRHYVESAEGSRTGRIVRAY